MLIRISNIIYLIEILIFSSEHFFLVFPVSVNDITQPPTQTRNSFPMTKIYIKVANSPPISLTPQQ